jgi:hypothetical protein
MIAESIMVWVLMIAPYDGRSNPVISQNMSDLVSCQRMQKFITANTGRSTQCVEIAVPHESNKRVR